MDPYWKSRMSGKRGRWAVPLVLLVIMVVASVPGIGYAEDPAKVPPGAFKTATTCVPNPFGIIFCYVSIAGMGVTNILSLSITAPAAGFVYVSATGSCQVNQIAFPVSWGYVIGTSATEGFPAFVSMSPQPAFDFANGMSVLLVPLVVDRVFTVSAGANKFFLNVDQLTSSSLVACAGRMTAFFTTTMLP